MMRWMLEFFETERRRGLWLLLVAVGVGTVLQMFTSPGAGYAVAGKDRTSGEALSEPASVRGDRAVIIPMDSGTVELIRRGGRTPATAPAAVDSNDVDSKTYRPMSSPFAGPPAGALHLWNVIDDASEDEADDRTPPHGAAVSRPWIPGLFAADSAFGGDLLPARDDGEENGTAVEAERAAFSRSYTAPGGSPAAPAPPPEPGDGPGEKGDDQNGEWTDPYTESGDDDAHEAGAAFDNQPASAQLILLGPSAAEQGEFVTFTLAAENVRGLAHAPLHLVYDPQILEFVSAEEGAFFSSDGSATQFFASTSTAPGSIEIAISRMPPAGGIDGSGGLCEVTFLTRAPGMSPIVTAGSRLLDADARLLSFRSSDAYVSVD